jgi:hypothetical protein
MIGFVNNSTGHMNNFELNTQPTPAFLQQITQTDAQL